MANTINDLYSKYTNRVERTLENDRYFQYLYEMVQAGNNTLQQKNRILHKVVDERWLTVVEEGVQAIFNIVDKPRRFIATTEEVVPVALAKKITSESVRHLSQNTQFINMNPAGEIQPTHVLNVTTEESFDLYENRFVYHLIQRLFTFVDKRTDVIFWSTGDETCNTMSMESKVDDAYEEISYKVEMTIKNRQSYVENDTDNMDVFKRIDRVRRMSRTLRSSAFCDIMSGCAKVHSPIQRTNLMMKDPDYRTCYKLWQFIENYDEVGYTIEAQDTALEFDEEYLVQMYINMITNYTVFKSLLESDPRKMTEIATKKRKPVKPKFVKKIQEEIVDDCNIEDVEIRQVFVEEVTEAQLEAEAKLKEQTERCEELENNLSDMEWQLDSLNQQIEMLEEMKQQVEDEKSAMEAQLEAERTSKEEVQAKAAEELAAVQEKAAQEIQTAREEADERVRMAEDEAEQSVSRVQNEMQEKLDAAQSRAEAQMKLERETRESAAKEAGKALEKYKKMAEELEKVKDDLRKSERKVRTLEKEKADAKEMNAVKAEENRQERSGFRPFKRRKTRKNEEEK
ncbi:MAG: DUF2357 domain-containing protein [Roseburia inulinivorans]|nr:DUF2357 domain-containing protein [bacterium]MDY3040120.1 DUF2357 domain-containing protein [Roseburia inulinivorans]